MKETPARSERVGGSPTAPALADAAWLLGLKGLVSAIVLAAGFTALSDDDFARVVIAQKFAETPALDPSGTSWLPFPFWAYGVSALVFGSSLGVARATAVVLGCASALIVGAAARVLGLSRRSALIGAGLAAIFPYSALLGVATVPEAPTAALSLFGAATLPSGPRLRALGAAALFVACGSRYEAWAVAGVFSVFTAIDAFEKRRLDFAASAAVALAFPVLWVLHGVVRHGDPWFFVARVSAYRAALGAPSSFWTELVRAPSAIVTTEPELVALFATLLALAFAAGQAQELRRFSRFGLALGAVIVFLVAGDVRGSAPTHHAERALLAVWFGLAVMCGFTFECIARRRSRALTRGAVALVALAVAGFAVRPQRAPEAFGARRDEIDLGERARARGVKRLAIDAPDFGFFAIQAAFARPSATVVLDEQDPRRPRPLDRLALSPAALQHDLHDLGLDWLAVPRSRAALARGLGAEREANAGWVLIELRSERERGSGPRSRPGIAAQKD